MERYVMVVPVLRGRGPSWVEEDSVQVESSVSKTVIETRKLIESSGFYSWIHVVLLESDRPFEVVIKRSRRYRQANGNWKEHQLVEKLGCLESPSEELLRELASFNETHSVAFNSVLEKGKYISPGVVEPSPISSHSSNSFKRSPEDGGSPPARKHNPEPVWGGRKFAGGDV
jgi:hypothetical protein